MTLSVTPGAPDANSLVTLAEAQDYIEKHFSAGDIAIWNAFEAERQEELLVLGAGILGYLPFSGSRTYINQAQVFPRHKWSGIPSVIKNAQIELTMNVVLRADLVRPEVSSGAEATSKITNVSLAGIISVGFGDEGDNSGTLLDQLTRNINLQTMIGLRPYLTSIRGGVIGSSKKYQPIPFEG